MPPKKKKKTHWRYDNPHSSTDQKSYYTIGEVAKLFDIEETQLRYWERHTPLAPQRANGSGTRLYTQDDMKLVEKIRYLLVDKGMSLQAISDQLKNSGPLDTDLQIREKLLQARERISYLKDLVDLQLRDGDEPKV